jgi:transposase InsO family protein
MEGLVGALVETGMLRDTQVRLLRKQMANGMKQESAAAMAGMSVRSARRWQEGKLPSDGKGERTWRTREDPFLAVWETEIVPMLVLDKAGILEAATVLEVLCHGRPGRFRPGQVRTLQRRISEWRALWGPPKRVKFRQEQVPGREGAIDFSHADDLGVTIAGELFAHLLFHLVLPCSGWTWVSIAFQETFEALSAALQEALWALGGAPAIIRSDNLSAATRRLGGGRALTKRYRSLVEHYGAASTRITPGESHENGSVEKTHHLVKSLLAQHLVIRGSSDFADVEAYLRFARDVVDRTRNVGMDKELAEERSLLRPLPLDKVPNYSAYRPRVTCWSTVSVGGRIYSVPARLVGHEVDVRVHPDIVEVRFHGKLTERMPRLRGDKGHRVDYRHIIWSLVRKPGAFARYRYREDLFPSLIFRRAYDALRGFGERGDVEYVRILHLAASTYEATVETALALLLERGGSFDYVAVKALASPEQPVVPSITIPPPDLAQYDRLRAQRAAGAS